MVQWRAAALLLLLLLLLSVMVAHLMPLFLRYCFSSVSPPRLAVHHTLVYRLSL